jgi:hypothetical protein
MAAKATLRLSACLIARNERRNVRGCFESFLLGCLARTLCLAKRYAQAARRAEESMVLFPDALELAEDGPVPWTLAICAWQRGDHQVAFDHASAVLRDRRAPRHIRIEAGVRAASAACELERVGAACTAAETVLELLPPSGPYFDKYHDLMCGVLALEGAGLARQIRRSVSLGAMR